MPSPSPPFLRYADPSSPAALVASMPGAPRRERERTTLLFSEESAMPSVCVSPRMLMPPYEALPFSRD